MHRTRSAQIGTFVKTGAPQLIEVLGSTALDFVVIDAEHAPFDRGMLDLMVMGGHAARIPVFIRIPEMNPAVILSCLDIGAAGLLVPHVDSAEQAREVVAMARYRGGRRGYSGGPRCARYASLSMAQALHQGDQAQIICQIESAQAVAQAQAIAEVPDVAGLFVGRADLALAMGLDDARAPAVLQATQAVLQAATRADKLAGMHVGGTPEREQFMHQGANWFVVASDQTLLRQAVQAIAGAGPKDRSAAA
ncbi:aldolase [Verminephrobacter aporrectodeae subsp. tuberculatae]|uniref:HpcH/HpaI aldolase family protein n=1 Tax=Verminephrobacter aporrectodeae TaxID=1110389 RepID=UPI00023781C2|nr:aldolase/citrate lyase family protein [Verminephrobacter aporrectodeae]MCW8208012.1 aldolase [Verminephrobacter aporrectodeae subsp. tuberculatae]